MSQTYLVAGLDRARKCKNGKDPYTFLLSTDSKTVTVNRHNTEEEWVRTGDAAAYLIKAWDLEPGVIKKVDRMAEDV